MVQCDGMRVAAVASRRIGVSVHRYDGLESRRVVRRLNLDVVIKACSVTGFGSALFAWMSQYIGITRSSPGRSFVTCIWMLRLRQYVDSAA